MSLVRSNGLIVFIQWCPFELRKARFSRFTKRSYVLTIGIDSIRSPRFLWGCFHLLQIIIYEGRNITLKIFQLLQTCYWDVYSLKKIEIHWAFTLELTEFITISGCWNRCNHLPFRSQEKKLRLGAEKVNQIYHSQKWIINSWWV